MTQEPVSFQTVLAQAEAARDAAQWEKASYLYIQLEKALPQSPEIKHNLGLVYFGWGKLNDALHWCAHALILNPNLWQSAIIVSLANKGMGQMEAAQRGFQSLLGHKEGGAQARVGLADLAMNQFGNPLEAIELVKPLHQNSQYAMDAQLTSLMASLYDRDNWQGLASAKALSKQIQQFSAQYLRLPQFELPPLVDRTTAYDDPRYRPRVGLISPLFCVSPVYFLTIAGWRHVAKGCDIAILNRGHQLDWATQAFKELSSEWINVQHLNAQQLAKRIHEADLDVLYDLGGWMDAVGLRALSCKPARQMFKWVGGQSVTTGLDAFDGWIGDDVQSPSKLQGLYSEPLINIPGGYCTYTPPDYLPAPAASKSKTPCIFANPAKVSRAFLAEIKKIRGSKVFIHNQYRYPQVQERIRKVLGKDAEFVIPTSHQEALQAVNSHQVMIDTFPYSGGLTAREAIAMGTKVQVLRVGELFCERHTAKLA
jgi:predicted O-linked N-acetylglucosamine transferase (SPINDLY family)